IREPRCSRGLPGKYHPGAVKQGRDRAKNAHSRIRAPYEAALPVAIRRKMRADTALRAGCGGQLLSILLFPARLCSVSALRSGRAACRPLFMIMTNWQESYVQVLVRDNNDDQALRALKKKMQREGIFREMKMRGHYEKPSEKRAREKAEAVRRARKLARKRAQREGLIPGSPRAAAAGAARAPR